MHLGMTGRFEITGENPRIRAGDRYYKLTPDEKHAHVIFETDAGATVTYYDPRRFGSFHWLVPGAPRPLLDHLGPEPLSQEFDGRWLYERSRGRTGAVKAFIMDGKVVVGVGNIYANEALFIAGLRPDRAAGRISLAR